jgi:hypothetical protein
VRHWFATHAGKVRGGIGRTLQGAHTATTVRLDGPDPVD